MSSFWRLGGVFGAAVLVGIVVGVPMVTAAQQTRPNEPPRPTAKPPQTAAALSSARPEAPRAAEPARSIEPTRPAEPAQPPRETFVVVPFVNLKNAKALDYLEAALPALIAERLAQHAPLRFVGGPSIFPPAAPGKAQAPVNAAAKWVVEGTFERQADWTIAITVTVRRQGGEGAKGEATVTAPKDAAAGAGVQAALEAFGTVPGLKLNAAAPGMTGAFGRDPYAFVLYGRGVAAYLGLGNLRRSPERAMEMFRRSLLIDPKVAEARRYLGFVHLEGGRPAQARAMWTYALDVRSNYLAALVGLAALDRTAGLPSARDHYAQIVDLDPEDMEARRTYGELLYEAGAMEQAEVELGKVVQANPNDLRARRSLALVLAARRAGPELVSELEQVVKLDPDDLEARMDLAAAYTSLGRVTDAETVYDEVLRRRPKHGPALKLSADLARTRGDVTKAAELYGKLRLVAPQDPRPVFLLGSAQYDAGNIDAAERLFSEGARYPGMQGDAYSNLGAIALRKGQAKEALWFLSRAAKKRPDKANVRFNHAMALYAMTRHADALNELRTAETLDPGDAGIKFFSGVVSLRLGLLREAEQSFREALRLDPKHDDARHNLTLLEPLVHPRREASVSLIETVPLQKPATTDETLTLPIEQRK